MLKGRTKYWIAAAIGLLLAVVIAAGCLGGGTKATGGKADKGSAGVPDKEVAAEIVAPPAVPKPLDRDEPALVKVKLETTEVVREIAPGVKTTQWTFNGSVPGPMIRVRKGDTVELTLENENTSKMLHSIDLHAVNGPGGGAKVTQVVPGKSATFRFKALNQGLYVYHCATPVIPEHVSRGMYGMILVEPEEGLPKVDKELYVMQGDFYLQDKAGATGTQEFDQNKLIDENPDYIVFNGGVGAIADKNAMKTEVGDKVRIYFGVGGANVTSSFHVIGEIFDSVYPEGSREALHDVQTTLVPAGGATMVDFKVDVPGTYLLVDHSLGRLLKGAAGHLVAEGEEDKDIFEPREGALESQNDGH